MRIKINRRLISYMVTLLLLLISLCGCEEKHESYVSPLTTIRDNTPICLVTEHSGVLNDGNDLVTVDYSNTEEGYVMVDYEGLSTQVKLQITGPDYMTYTYDIHTNGWEAFPLSAGDGEYSIGVYEQIDGTQYSTIYSSKFEFEVTNTFGPYLYPNQYVKFNADSRVVADGAKAVETAHDDLEAIGLVYNYVMEQLEYDTPKANSLTSGYVPNPDEALDTGLGICLDYAAVMASMLRSQRIPTRMEVGYAGTAYHAWISTYVENVGWINGMVEFDGENWSLMDPTVVDSSGEEGLKKFIGDGGSYLTQYTY